MNLPEINCPICNRKMVNNPISSNESVQTADTHDKCLRKCLKCRVAYSNAKNNPTLIYEDYHFNIPKEVREHLDPVLSNALNIRSRPVKKKRFAYNSSEDALSWTMFRYAQISNTLTNIVEYITNRKYLGRIHIYYWGVPIDESGIIDNQRKERLENLLIEIGEDPQSLSEPDIIIEDDDKIIIFEVKLNSSNNKDKDKAKWKKYSLNYFNNDILVNKNLNDYQLVRNWYIGNEMAVRDNKKLYLINLVLKNSKNDNLEEFIKTIKETNTAHFKIVTWKDIFNNCFDGKLPDSIIEWLGNRKPKIVNNNK